MDLDDLLGNSPSWPPFNNQNQNSGDDDREPGSGEWVDKLMVNRQDPVGVENPITCWNPTNANVYPENNPCTILPASNQIDLSPTDYLDELDAGTSDSSEPDLLWQFNHSKLGSFSNGIGQNVKKPHAKQTKSPELR